MMRKLYTTFIILSLYISLTAQTYYSQCSNGCEPSSISNWNSQADGSGIHPPGFAVNNAVFIIQSGDSMAATSPWTLSGTDMTLEIAGNAVLQANDTISVPASADLVINNGGTYRHNNASDDIFKGTESINNNSTVIIEDWGSTTIPHIGFGNLTIIAPAISNDLLVNTTLGDTFEVHGNLQILNTGSYYFQIAKANDVVLSVEKDFIIDGGNFDFGSGTSFQNKSMILQGSLFFTSGIWENQGTEIVNVYFKQDTTASINFTGGSFSANTLSDINWTIDISSKIILQSNFEVGTGRELTLNGQLVTEFYTIEESSGPATFNLNAGSLLTTGHPLGVSGTVNLTNKNYDPFANYRFDSYLYQNTGFSEENITEAGFVTIAGNIVIQNGINFDMDINTTLNVAHGTTFIVPDDNNFFGQGVAVANIDGLLSVMDVNGATGPTGCGCALENFFNIQFPGNGTVEYSATVDQVITVNTNYNHLILSNQGNKQHSGNGPLIVYGNLEVRDSAVWDVVGDTTWIYENFMMGQDTEYYGGSNTQIAFKGSFIQEAALYNSTITLNEVVIDNTNGILLLNDVTVSDIEFMDGNIILADNNLTLTGNNMPEGKSNSFIQTDSTGRVIREIANTNTYLFPIGQNAYLPVELTCNNCSGVKMAVGVDDEIYLNPEI